MDAPTSPSFIPKKPVVGGAGTSGTSAAFGMFIFFICVLLFIASAVAAGAAFFYKGYLTTSLASKQEMLKKRESTIDESAITHFKRLDARLSQTEALLQRHTTLLGLFGLLSQEALSNVQFTQFSYDITDDGKAKLSLSGNADSFSTLALQSDALGTTALLHNVVFSGIAVASDGKVGFTVAADIDPALVSYAKNLTAQNAPTIETPAASSSPTTQP